MNTSDLAIRTTVRELVAAFVAAERDVRAAFAQIVAAEERVNEAFGLAPGDRYASGFLRVSACGTEWRDDFRDADQAVALMNRAAWRALVDRLELRRMMSVKAWERLQRQLDDSKSTRGDLPDMPPLTEETALAFARGMMGQAPDMMRDAVREVWDFLRPRGAAAKLKTNSQLEVPESVILPYVVEPRWIGTGFTVDYRYRQNLVALERVFHALAGDGRMNLVHESELGAAIDASADGVGQTSLFAFRACKNRNLHLRILRLDLLADFNALAAGKTLRPAESEGERLRREVAAAKAENERLRRQARA